jgi:hypothetical protein
LVALNRLRNTRRKLPKLHPHAKCSAETCRGRRNEPERLKRQGQATGRPWRHRTHQSASPDIATTTQLCPLRLVQFAPEEKSLLPLVRLSKKLGLLPYSAHSPNRQIPDSLLPLVSSLAMVTNKSNLPQQQQPPPSASSAPSSLKSLNKASYKISKQSSSASTMRAPCPLPSAPRPPPPSLPTNRLPSPPCTTSTSPTSATSCRSSQARRPTSCRRSQRPLPPAPPSWRRLLLNRRCRRRRYPPPPPHPTTATHGRGRDAASTRAGEGWGAVAVTRGGEIRASPCAGREGVVLARDVERRSGYG